MSRLSFALILALILSCSDGGTTGPKVEPVATVVVSPPSGSLEVGQTLQLVAAVMDAKGNVLSGRTVTWSSSNESAATVNSSGLVTGLSEGTVAITATCEGRSGSASVSILDLTIPPAPSDITAVPLSNTEIQVSWADNSDNEDEFRIDREPVSQGMAGSSGRPARAFAQVGTVGTNVTTFVDTGLESATSYKYRVQACNENGCSDPSANQTETSTYAELIIETESLPISPVGVAFEQTLTATGGDGTYTWSMVSGSLPDGIDLNADSGIISGTPTAMGFSTFTVQVQSGDEQTATRDLALVIRIDCAAQSEIPELECDGLVAIYESTNGPGWWFSSGWLVDPSPCSWEEVLCEGGQVSSIELTENQLVGTIPPEVGNFSSLRVLDLWGNQLTGSIPSELGNLENLKYLDLEGNQLTGSIPSELGNLENLTYLGLNTNQLTGSIPSELGNLENLTELWLYQNELTGSIPFELVSLARLEKLVLWSNQLTGAIPPELGNLANLYVLSVGENQLTGDIPSELGGLSHLIHLSFDSNQLTGTIPAELGSLSHLWELDLDHNQLTGTIPAELGRLSNLVYLYLDTNQLTGTIPAEFGSLWNLESLHLEANQLTGTIPAEFGSLWSLESLHLESNQLTGTIPAELGGLWNLEDLYLESNQLTGAVPLAVAQLGGQIQTWSNFWGDCDFQANEGLYIPDDPDYRAADLDADGFICYLAVPPATRPAPDWPLF